jgi:hypothetical protein
MKYFASIANTYYFRWQAELLIESFKKLGLQDELVIGVADVTDTGMGFARNLNAHRYKFHHVNQADRGYPALNKLYSACIAAESGLLGKEWAFLHPDMMLVKPISSPDYDRVLMFHPEAARGIQGHLRQRRFSPEMGMLGQTMVFKKPPPEFLRTALRCHEALLKNGSPFPEKMAWAWALSKTSLPLFGKAMEMSLLHYSPSAPVIHYKHGMPPGFHKRYFTQEIALAESEDPCEVLLKYNPSPASDLAQKVVLSYEKGRD